MIFTGVSCHIRAILIINDTITTSSQIHLSYFLNLFPHHKLEGMELHPRILGWDVKMFTNCRSGMMFWAVGIICFAHKNMEVNDGVLQIGMAVNVILQLIYITKFFHWEMGYMCSKF